MLVRERRSSRTSVLCATPWPVMELAPVSRVLTDLPPHPRMVSLTRKYTQKSAMFVMWLNLEATLWQFYFLITNHLLFICLALLSKACPERNGTMVPLISTWNHPLNTHQVSSARIKIMVLMLPMSKRQTQLWINFNKCSHLIILFRKRYGFRWYPQRKRQRRCRCLPQGQRMSMLRKPIQMLLTWLCTRSGRDHPNCRLRSLRTPANTTKRI